MRKARTTQEIHDGIIALKALLGTRWKYIGVTEMCRRTNLTAAHIANLHENQIMFKKKRQGNLGYIYKWNYDKIFDLKEIGTIALLSREHKHNAKRRILQHGENNLVVNQISVTNAEPALPETDNYETIVGRKEEGNYVYWKINKKYLEESAFSRLLILLKK